MKNSINRRDFLSLMGTGAASFGLSSSFLATTRINKQSQRPNVILILTDDQGYGDLGCYGATKIPTPNMDRVAAEGMRFTDFYAGSTVCAPSRAGLLTGKYQQRFGFECNGTGGDLGIALDEDAIQFREQVAF